MAIGQVGLKPIEFYAMTYGEFARACYHHDILLITQWQHSRFLAAHMYRLLGVKNVTDKKILELWIDYLESTDDPTRNMMQAGSKESLDFWEEYDKRNQNKPLP